MALARSLRGSFQPSANVTSGSVTPGAASVGTLLVVAAEASGTVTPTISDSAGNTWTSIGPVQTTAGTILSVSVFYCVVSTALTATDTITVSRGTSASLTFTVEAWTGQDTASPVYSATTNQASTGGTSASGSAISAAAGDAVFAVIGTGGGTTSFVAGTGLATDVSFASTVSNPRNGFAESAILGSATSVTPAGSWTNSSTWALVAFGIKAAGSVPAVSASFAGSGTFSATAQVGNVPAGFAGTGSFSATASVVGGATTDFSGSGQFTASAGITRAAVTASFSGSGQFAAAVGSQAAFPVLQVLLDDGTGTFPYDVTAWVHMPTGLRITRGRADETPTLVDPSTLELRLDNVDGRFTIGSPTYGIKVDQRIRVIESVGGTVSNRFTGYVSSWPTQWPTPTGSYAVATITAYDRQPRLQRIKLRSIADYEALAITPRAYYPLDEDNPAATAGGDRTPYPNRAAKLQHSKGNTKPTFGAQVSPYLTGGLNSQGDGDYLQARLSASIDTYPGVTLAAFVQTADADGIIASLSGSQGVDDSVQIRLVGTGAAARINYRALGSGDTETTLDLGGALPVVPPGYPYPLNDGEAHHVALTVTGTSTPGKWGVRLYADGVFYAFQTIADSVRRSYFDTLTIGKKLAGSIYGVAVWDRVLTGYQIATIASAGLTGRSGVDTADQRIAALAGYAGIPSTELALEVGHELLAGQATGGSSLADAIEAATQTEGGVAFVNGTGQIVLQNRAHRVNSASGPPQIALDTTEVDPGLVWAADTAYLVNRVTATGPTGALQVAEDAASIADHEEWLTDLPAVLLLTDDAVLSRAQWTVARYSQPRPRLSSVIVDALTLPARQSDLVDLELGDRITVANLPAQSPMSTADLIVEGITETITDQDWTFELTTVPSSLFAVLTLDNPVTGVLDAYPLAL